MSHDFIDYGNRHILLHDMDIWTLRHFFHRVAEAATPTDLETDESTLMVLRQFFGTWDWLGPGVVTGANLSGFVQGQPYRLSTLVALFERTLVYLNGFGTIIPLDYLRQHVNTPVAFFHAAQPTNRFIEAVESLRGLLLEAQG